MGGGRSREECRRREACGYKVQTAELWFQQGYNLLIKGTLAHPLRRKTGHQSVYVYYLEELTLRNVMQAINRKACIDYLHQYHILFLIETWPHYSHEIDAAHERAVIAVNIFGKMSNLKKFAHVWENIW